MKLFTIGFTKKSAAQFFGLLRGNGATTLVDTRLNNVSQLAGFTKRDDLQFFASELCDMSYRHELRLAPSDELLAAYKKGRMPWETYAGAYLELIRVRRVEATLRPEEFDNAVLLCSEPTPDHCHRRLAAEYLAAAWGGVEVVHL
ncbi:uncharacterized protein (DUF488 family) [Agromyces flavus]|uniref:Uncharacterized protein (DUF488 family) n=1 Tax=Agromyces flavus TaxID=589382 RepID=A0A1H1WXB6_9MICO|nr:DUF488 domain-containing protein [Agromyces flavus]MCP2366262.1 uncharacterized protein (DUF488 family) [Agromyces flavus]GGI44322.1 hypothetical protein GCM10010932_04030 [Agromyces flavus]SDT00849.1 Protein of unknown function, DUF488 [Agromyces flavus]